MDYNSVAVNKRVREALRIRKTQQKERSLNDVIEKLLEKHDLRVLLM